MAVSRFQRQICGVCRKTSLEEGRRFKFCAVCCGVSYCSESCYAQHNLKHQVSGEFRPSAQLLGHLRETSSTVPW